MGSPILEFALRYWKFLRFQNSRFNRVSGDRTERVTPVPIPNTEVKPLRADGTARATAWETRSLPGLTKDSEEPQGSSEFFVLYLETVK